MATLFKQTAEPKASRVRVWQAVEKIVKAGRRPTVQGVREVLGGGSPNSVTAYINEWYQELGSRLASAEPSVPGVPPQAISLLAELWRVASSNRGGAAGGAGESSETLIDLERTALVAEIKALEAMNKEFDKRRLHADRALSEARALLLRSEAAREAEGLRATSLEQELAQVKLELEVGRVREQLTRASPRHSHTRGKRKGRRGSTARATPKKTRGRGSPKGGRAGTRTRRKKHRSR
jgi:hypothetical protein